MASLAKSAWRSRHPSAAQAQPPPRLARGHLAIELPRETHDGCAERADLGLRHPALCRRAVGLEHRDERLALQERAEEFARARAALEVVGSADAEHRMRPIDVLGAGARLEVVDIEKDLHERHHLAQLRLDDAHLRLPLRPRVAQEEVVLAR